MFDIRINNKELGIRLWSQKAVYHYNQPASRNFVFPELTVHSQYAPL